MPCVVAHPEAVADQARHARTAPQRCREAVGLGACEQQCFELIELLASQQRFAAGAAGLGQPGCALFAELPHPAADALLSRFDSPRRLGLAEPFFDNQTHRLDTPPL